MNSDDTTLAITRSVTEHSHTMPQRPDTPQPPLPARGPIALRAGGVGAEALEFPEIPAESGT